MLRLIYICVFSCFFIVVGAQNVEVQKSTEMIVIRGKSYYLHTVLPGQTLYSICKTYGLSVEEVKVMNDKKDNSLSPYDMLKLPYQELFIQQDEEYYYHKVAEGETLYSIARHYDIKPKKLLKSNQEYEATPLSIGAIVRLPLDDIDLSVLNSQGTQITNVVVPVDRAVVIDETKEEKEPKNRKERKNQAEIDRMLDSKVDLVENVDFPTEDSLPLSNSVIISSNGNREIPAYISEVAVPSNSFVKIALLLPFWAEKYSQPLDVLPSNVIFVDTLKAKNTKVSGVITDASERFIRFYEGILIAVDSLKKQGYKVELHVFDTERSSEKMYLLVDEINRLNPDLIMGPIYGSTYKVLIDSLQNKNTPMIYPLSSLRSENFGQYSNFVQVNSSFQVLADQMLDWLANQRDTANIVNLNVLNIDYADSHEKQAFRDSLKQMEGVRSFDWDMEETPLDSLRILFLPDKENILVLPLGEEADVSKYLTQLSTLTDVYPITVLGLPDWQNFESVDHATYYKLNTKIFTHNYVDYSKEATKAIVEKFRKYYYTEPNPLTLKAFDMGLYFIELAAKYRHNTLAALEYYDRSTDFFTFRFRKMKDGIGKENNGFYMVNFTPDFQLKVERMQD